MENINNIPAYYGCLQFYPPKAKMCVLWTELWTLPKKPYDEALTLNVTVFGNRVFKR